MLRRTQNLIHFSHDPHGEPDNQDYESSEAMLEKVGPGILVDSDVLPHIEARAQRQSQSSLAVLAMVRASVA